MHHLTTRPQTPEEQRRIARRARLDVASYGCMTIFTGVGSVIMLGLLGGWLGGLISEGAASYGRWIGSAAGAGFFGCMLVSYSRFDRRKRRLAAEDVEAGVVEEIRVVEPRVIEIFLRNDNEPILAFEIGDGRLLYLQGPWLRDPLTYGTELPDDDEYAPFVNGLPEPYAFPATHFTLTRFPKSGIVLGICVEGGYLKPEKTVDILKREYDFGESALFDGSLDDLASVLSREHTRRATC